MLQLARLTYVKTAPAFRGRTGSYGTSNHQRPISPAWRLDDNHFHDRPIPTPAGYLQPQRSGLMRLSTMARIPGCPVSTTRRKPRLAGGHAGRATAGPRVADKAFCTKRLV